MSETRPENPPAFPGQTNTEWILGMSLRDYFAGQAMLGLVSLPIVPVTPSIAAQAYLMADAMLAERALSRAPR